MKWKIKSKTGQTNNQSDKLPTSGWWQIQRKHKQVVPKRKKGLFKAALEWIWSNTNRKVTPISWSFGHGCISTKLITCTWDGKIRLSVLPDLTFRGKLDQIVFKIREVVKVNTLTQKTLVAFGCRPSTINTCCLMATLKTTIENTFCLLWKLASTLASQHLHWQNNQRRQCLWRKRRIEQQSKTRQCVLISGVFNCFLTQIASCQQLVKVQIGH